MVLKYFDIPIRGIDVSEFNGAVDWSKVKADFTAIRVGHGRVIDPRFAANWAGAKGKTFRLPYWYMDYYSHRDPTTSAYGISDVDWGRIQAEKYWGAVKDDPSGIVFLDIESASVADATVQAVWDRVEVIAKAFLQRADELSGQVNGIYCSLSLTSAFSAWFRNRPLWVAWYNEAQTPESVIAAVKARGWTGKILIWQYASDGDIDGDNAGDGLSMGMAYKFLDLNAWIAGEDEWKMFKGETMANYPAKLYYPLPTGIRISQLFGERPSIYTTSKGHNGVDWACAVGTQIYAMQDGVVIRAADFSQPGITDGKVGYGRHVRIQHPQGVSIYGHLSRLMVAEGDSVKAGQQIGLSGGATNDPNSGYSTGPHLHAEYRMDGIKNPVPGGYVYNAIDILPLLNSAPVEPEPPLPEGKARTLVNLNIRKGAGTSYGIWATAPKGTLLDVLEIRGDWVRVGWNQWCMSNYNGMRYLEAN